MATLATVLYLSRQLRQERDRWREDLAAAARSVAVGLMEAVDILDPAKDNTAGQQVLALASESKSPIDRISLILGSATRAAITHYWSTIDMTVQPVPSNDPVVVAMRREAAFGLRVVAVAIGAAAGLLETGARVPLQIRLPQETVREFGVEYRVDWTRGPAYTRPLIAENG